MSNLRDRLICAINKFYDNNDSNSAEELADYLIDEIDELSQNTAGDYITFKEISSMIKYAQSKDNIRNLVMLYFVLIYGMKRGNLLDLKWNQFKIDNSGKMMLYNYSSYTDKIPVPDFLSCALKELKEYYKYKEIDDEYVFCSVKDNGRRMDKRNIKLGETQINIIFNEFVGILGNDEKCNPSYIRNKLPMFLMLQGCDLKEILVYFNIEFYSLNNYVNEKDLERLFNSNFKHTSIINLWENIMKKI